MKPASAEALADIAAQLHHLAALIEELGGPPATGDTRLQVDLRSLTVIWRGKRVPNLSAGQTRLVAFLARRPGIIRSRWEMLEHIGSSAPNDRSADMYIRRCRRAFEAVDPEFDAIKVIYGEGYSWRA